MLSMRLSAYYYDLSSQSQKLYPCDSIKSTHKGYQLLAVTNQLNCGIQMIWRGIILVWKYLWCLTHISMLLIRCILAKVHRCGTRGRLKNAYELLNLRALKVSMLYKNHIFQYMGKIFCVEFQRVPLKFHTKYLTHILKDVDFIHKWKFKSS